MSEKRPTLREMWADLPLGGKVFFGVMTFFVVITPVATYFTSEGWIRAIYSIISLAYAFLLGMAFGTFAEMWDAADDQADEVIYTDTVQVES